MKSRVFVQSSKNQNEVLLGVWLCQVPGTLLKKNPPPVGKYKNFEMHNKQSPHISPPPPPPPPGGAGAKGET